MISVLFSLDRSMTITQARETLFDQVKLWTLQVAAEVPFYSHRGSLLKPCTTSLHKTFFVLPVYCQQKTDLKNTSTALLVFYCRGSSNWKHAECSQWMTPTSFYSCQFCSGKKRREKEEQRNANNLAELWHSGNNRQGSSIN